MWCIGLLAERVQTIPQCDANTCRYPHQANGAVKVFGVGHDVSLVQIEQSLVIDGYLVDLCRNWTGVSWTLRGAQLAAGSLQWIQVSALRT